MERAADGNDFVQRPPTTIEAQKKDYSVGRVVREGKGKGRRDQKVFRRRGVLERRKGKGREGKG